MGRIAISVSITPEQDKFMQENNIKPSSILQSEINSLMASKLSPEYLKQLQQELENKQTIIDQWKEMFYKAKAFIEIKGFAEEFNKILME